MHWFRKILDIWSKRSMFKQVMHLPIQRPRLQDTAFAKGMLVQSWPSPIEAHPPQESNVDITSMLRWKQSLEIIGNRSKRSYVPFHFSHQSANRTSLMMFWAEVLTLTLQSSMIQVPSNEFGCLWSRDNVIWLARQCLTTPYPAGVACRICTWVQAGWETGFPLRVPVPVCGTPLSETSAISMFNWCVSKKGCGRSTHGAGSWPAGPPFGIHWFLSVNQNSNGDSQRILQIHFAGSYHLPWVQTGRGVLAYRGTQAGLVECQYHPSGQSSLLSSSTTAGPPVGKQTAWSGCQNSWESQISSALMRKERGGSLPPDLHRTDARREVRAFMDGVKEMSVASAADWRSVRRMSKYQLER